MAKQFSYILQKETDRRCHQTFRPQTPVFYTKDYRMTLNPYGRASMAFHPQSKHWWKHPEQPMYSMIAVILKLKRNIHVEDLLTRVFPKRRSTEMRLPHKTSYHNLIPVKKMLSLKLSVLPCLLDHYSKTANRKEFRGDECYIKTLNIIKKKAATASPVILAVRGKWQSDSWKPIWWKPLGVCRLNNYQC